MPKYEDLEFLQNQILKIGNENEILKNKNISPNLVNIPGKIIEKKDEIKEILDSDDLLKDISEDFKEGLSFDEEENFEELKEADNQEDFLSSIEMTDLSKDEDVFDTEPLEEISLDDFTKDKPKVTKSSEDSKKDWEDLKDESLLDLDNINMEEPSFDNKETEDSGIDEMSALLGGLNLEEPKEELPSDNIDDISALLGDLNLEEPKEELPSENIDDMSALLGDLNLEEPKEEALDFENMDMSSINLGLDEEEPSFVETEEKPSFGAEENDLDNLVSILENPEEKLEPKENILKVDDELAHLAGDFAETIIEEDKPIDFDTSFSDLMGENKKEGSDLGDISEIEEFKEESFDIDKNLEAPLGELEGFGDEEPNEGLMESIDFGEEKPSQEEGGDFDFGSLDSFTVDNVGVESEEHEEEIVIHKNKGAIRKKKDEELQLTDDERKQIVITLSSLPREVEIKISEAIISDKYSDGELKPLIDALIDKEKPQSIIKIYEKITGDTSLSKATSLKFTGQEFEEKQKSFLYLFEKNILPIISKIAGVALLLFLFIFIYFSLIKPTMDASHYYKIGKKNLNEKKFWEVEPYFEKAMDIQPRYNEAVDYARLYRKHKRYLESEKKYYLATNMKPNNELKLEFSDFFREIKDYERAVKSYEEMIKANNRNIQAKLGLGRTYFDWSNEIKDKMVDAKETYLDVLDIDKKNPDAIFGLLEIHLKEKDHKEVSKLYKYIEKTFPKKINPYIYADLADYLLDVGDVDEVKNILQKASDNAKKLNIPKIDYLYARYKKHLNINNEEKNHLENALKRFEIMKEREPERYGEENNQELLAKVYNDIGENYDRYSKVNIKAEEYYLKAIETYPHFGKPFYNLGNFALRNKVDYEGALNNYIKAEERGFTNDILSFNMGWLYYKKDNFYESYKRISSLLERYPDNSNLKYMIGTIFYKLKNYDLSESLLLETYNHFDDLKQMHYPLDMDRREDIMIVDMLLKVSNNLGAALQKKFEQTRNSKYLVWATKYYSDSIEYFSKSQEASETARKTESTEIDDKVRYKKFDIENANQNLRMVLYPDAGFDEPILYEDFTLNFTNTL